MQWEEEKVDLSGLEPLKEELGVSPILLRLLARLELMGPESIISFLYPKLAHLEDPFLLSNLEKAVDRILKSVHDKEKIYIFGDYDVDGVTSTTLLVSILRYFGNEPRFFVPRRAEEGYGLSLAILKRALDEGKPHLVIALDCGTNSVDEVKFLRDQGIDVAIVDHHRSKEIVPADCILMNPHMIEGPDSPWTHMCAVGLVFKLVHGLVKRLRSEGNELALKLQLKEYLDLVAMGTVADLVPLLGENRIVTRFGLQRLCKAERPGVKALFEVSGLTPGQDILPSDVSFRLGPRINASGRLADALLPVEMLLNDDFDACLKIARELNDMNRERQEIEKGVSEEAQKWVQQHQADKEGLVAFSASWHTGVVGIVAGKLARHFHRPTVVLGVEDGLAKGSGRSIEGINLVDVLGECADLLTSWGGHPMAVGISLPVDNIEKFRIAFNDAVSKRLHAELKVTSLAIACWLELNDIQDALMEDLSLLMPFGEGNPEPVFGLRKIKIIAQPERFGDNHYRFQVQVNPHKWINGVAWKQGNRMMPLGEEMDLAVKLKWNTWNGRKYIQMELIDWRKSE